MENSVTEMSSKENLTIIALSFAAVFLSFVKIPSALIPPQFWAEEYTIFYVDAHRLASMSILKTYAGYLHVLPRLIALILVNVPLAATPLAYKLASVVTLFILAMLAGFQRLRAEAYTRYIMVLMVILLPVGGEIFFNIANSITLAGAISLILFAQEPTTNRWLQLVELLTLLVTGLSGAFYLFLFPLVALRLWWTDLRLKIWYRFSAIMLITVVNFRYYAPGDRFQKSASQNWSDWIDCVTKFFRCFVVGTLPFGGAIFNAFALLTISILVAIVRSEIKIFGFKTPVASRSVFFMASGLLVWVASLWAFKDHPNLLTPNSDGDRYFYIPYLMIAYAIVQSDLKNTVASRLRLVALSTTIISSLICLRAKATVPDFNFAEQVRALDNAETYKLKIPPGWDIDLKDSPSSF